jgi:hypothetical protein
MSARWLPDGWTHPLRLDVPPGCHLRPIGEADLDLDYPAVVGSQVRLFGIFGPAWGWPPADITREQDRADLARHEREIEAHESFNYALFDSHETVLLGCVYIDPPFKIGADADVCWWVVDELVGSPLEAALETLVPSWIATAWPFEIVRYPGRDLSWEAWLGLPDC